MGKFNELSIASIDEVPEDFEDWSSPPPGSQLPASETEELRIQQAAVLSDLREAEALLLGALDRWKYHAERPEIEFLHQIHTIIQTARRTIE